MEKTKVSFGILYPLTAKWLAVDEQLGFLASTCDIAKCAMRNSLWSDRAQTLDFKYCCFRVAQPDGVASHDKLR